MRLKERMIQHFGVEIEFDGHPNSSRQAPSVASFLEHPEGTIIPFHMIGCPLGALSVFEEDDHLLETFLTKFLERTSQKRIGLVVRIVDHQRPTITGLLLANTSLEESVETLVEAPQDGNLSVDSGHLPESFFVLFGHALLLPDDQMLVLPNESGFFLSGTSLPVLCLPLCSFCPPSSLSLATFVSLPLDPILCCPKCIEHQFVYLLYDMKDTKLMFHILPYFLKSVFIQGRPVGDYHIRFDSHLLQMLQERIHMFLVVGIVDGEINGEITQRIRGVQNHLPPVMQLVYAQHSGEVRDRPLTAFLGVYLLMGPLKTLMNVSDRDRKAEIFLQAFLNLSVRKPVSNKRVGNDIAYIVGVLAFLGNAGNRGLKIPATVTAGTINAHPRPDQYGLSQPDMMNESSYSVDPLAAYATRGTGKKTSVGRTDTQCERPSCRYEEHSAWPESSFSWTAKLHSQSISAGFRPFFCSNPFSKQLLCMN